MSVAAKVAWWERWMPGGLSPSRSSGPSFATAATPVGPMVEILVNEMWIDISPDVRYADKITTTGGRPDESARSQANTCRFTLNNRDGRYSPRNPMSPYYGKIGRNTQVRVSVNQEGTQRFRFHGEIVAWPQEWDLTGNDVFVRIEAAGILRRLNQGASPLRSTLYRGLTRATVDPVVGYWPMEDGANSRFLATALPNTKNMVIYGVPELAASTAFACSDALPTMGTGALKAIVPRYTVTGETQIRFLALVPAAGVTDQATIATIYGSGTASRWELYYISASNTYGFRAHDADGVIADSFTVNPTFNAIRGAQTRVSIELTQSGSDVAITVSVYYADVGNGAVLVNDTDTFLNLTVGKITSIMLSPGGNIGDMVMGHLSVQTNTTSSFDLGDQTDAYNGETTLSRIRRLCSEEGILLKTFTGNNTSPAMGPQRIKTLADLIQECVDTDMGILFEPRDQFGLGWRTRGSLEVQQEAFSLDYTASDLFEPPVPVDDDQLSRNDITVTRDQGSSARAVLESGALSVLPPPNGIGLYDDAPTISVEDDDQLADQAGWRLHMGTVDEPRYPVVTVHLKRPSFTASYDLTAAVLLAKPGDRYLIFNTPAWLPPGDVASIMNSYNEWFDQFEHVITFNGAPASPYQVAYLDDADLGRADTEGSYLVNAVGASDTSLTVATSTGEVWIDSATYPSEFPFFVMMGGEKINVTAITGTTSPQTFTVDRGVNAITKSQVAGEDIRLFQPMIIAL